MSPSATPPEEQKDDQLIKLSPFEVNSTMDRGYQSASTLAGTRLNTPLKDLAGSISIYTKDFLEDINANDVSSLLVFATSMESSGGNVGNFSGTSNDINNARSVTDDTRFSPQDSTRSRGLSAPTFTRDYVPTSIPFDSYNISAYTVNRGPNAALFGTASPSGVVDGALLQAELGRDKNQIKLRYGSENSLRESLDINRVLIKDKLALRLALLRDDNNFQQKPGFEDRQRIYGTVRYSPTASTNLRASFESGNTRANRPVTTLPFQGFTKEWFDAGRPSYDWRNYDDPARNPNAASQEAFASAPIYMGDYLTYGIMMIYDNPNQAQASRASQYRLLTTTGTAANSVRSGTFNPIVNRDTATDTISFVDTIGYFTVPTSFWTGANLYPGQQPNTQPVGIKAQTFSDLGAFDWNHRMLDATSRQGDSFRTYNIAFSQSAWKDRVGFELKYDRQRYDSYSKNSFMSGTNDSWIFIDTSVVLPSGETNPNLGRPYIVSGQQVWKYNSDDRESQRATAYAKYDFRDLNATWGKWLGSHTLTGVYEHDSRDNLNYRTQLAVAGAASEATDPGPIYTSFRRPAFMVYLGPSLIGNNNPMQLNQINIAPPVAGPTPNVTYFVRNADATDPGHFESAPGSLVTVSPGGAANREVVESQAFALQSEWLDNLVMTTLGWRKDKDYYITRPFAFVPNPSDRNDPGKSSYGLNDFSFPYTPPPSVSKETRTMGVVVAWPNRLVPLPGGTDLRVFFNRSQNFTPIGGRVDFFGKPWPTPTGSTKEWGVTTSMLKDKLTVRVSRYQTRLKNVTNTPSGEAAAVLNTTLARAAGWETDVNTAPAMAAKSAADVALLFSALPSNIKDLYSYKVTGTPPNVVATSNNTAIAGVDTSDTNAEGLEADIIYNPTPNLKMLFNVAHQQTVQTNMAPFLKSFIAQMKPVFDQLSSRPAGKYPTGFQPGDTLPANTQTFGQYLDSTLYVPYATAVATEGATSGEVRPWRANIVASYTFGHDSIFGDTLKGWNVGGSLRWQDKMVIGYPSSRDPNGTAHFDIQRPYYAPALTNGSMWVGYERKIWKNIQWSIKLSADNILASKDLIPVNVQSYSGATAVYRIAPGTRWYIENTFNF